MYVYSITDILYLKTPKNSSTNLEKFTCIKPFKKSYTNPVTNNLYLFPIKRNQRNGGVIMSGRNRVEVPEAKEAMDRFKFEVADELGVPLSSGYNGNLTSYQNGSVGGMMVKKMIAEQEKRMAGK